MVTFGSRLQSLRNSVGLTQEEFARRLQISKSAVGMYERDEREPSFELVRKIADFFGVTTDYLLGRSDDPHGSAATDDGVSPEERAFLQWVKRSVKGVFFAEFEEAPEESKEAVMETLKWYWENVERKRIKREKEE
ncbi:MAG: helix-turn-helix domain-containing protein [Alicyclobacillus sp.]|nr:helix-turn-helix domain-containing protein [Alicyclobacillus sp.]